MDAESMLANQEQTANVVASLTGTKAQFIAAGWSPDNAELMVIEIMRHARHHW